MTSLSPAGAALALALAGCSSGYAVQPYAPTAGTFADMRDLQHVTQRGVRVGRFTTAREGGEVSCLPGATIDTPAGEPFSSYIRGALVSELKTAGVYSEAAPVMLTGVVRSIEPTSTSRGEWRIVLDVYSSNGISVQVEERHDFGVGRGANPCALAADEFMPAVQELVAKLVHDARFRELVAG